MAKTYHNFSGVCKWAKVYKADDMYKKYSIDVLLDEGQYKTLKSLKVKNNGKLEDGKMWVTFRRNEADGKPVVQDSEGKLFDAMIGNGSEVTVRISVESFVSKKFGPVTRSTLESVRVDKHVEYVKPEQTGDWLDNQKTDTPRPRMPGY